MKTIQTKQFDSVHDVPANAVFVTYSNHYRGNSGDDVYFTNNEGKVHDFLGNYWNMHDHINYEDRGVISTTQVIVEGCNQLETLIVFKQLCWNYFHASKELKDFRKNESIFENSYWFRFCHKRSLDKTIEKKRKQFYADRDTRNEQDLSILTENKQKVVDIFNSLGISVRIAYVLCNGY